MHRMHAAGSSSRTDKQQEQEEPGANQVRPELRIDTDAPAPKRRRRGGKSVGFGNVEIFTHSPRLAGDKVPTTEGPSVGLGRLQRVELRRVESFDESHERQGVNFLDPDLRVKLTKNSTEESIEEDISTAELTRKQREASLYDPNSPRSPSTAGPLFPDLAPLGMAKEELQREPTLSELFG